MRLMFIATAILCLIGSGCGSGVEMATVEGTVTNGGKPVSGIQVSFEPTELGGTAMGFTDTEGHYALQFPGNKEGAPLGEYKVTLSQVETDGEAEPVQIPEKYGPEGNLKRTVVSGENEFNFDLSE